MRSTASPSAPAPARRSDRPFTTQLGATSMTNIENPIRPVPKLKQSLADIDLAIRSAVEDIQLDGPMENIVVLHGYLAHLKRMAAEWFASAEDRFVAVLTAHGDE